MLGRKGILKKKENGSSRQDNDSCIISVRVCVWHTKCTKYILSYTEMKKKKIQKQFSPAPRWNKSKIPADRFGTVFIGILSGNIMRLSKRSPSQDAAWSDFVEMRL